MKKLIVSAGVLVVFSLLAGAQGFNPNRSKDQPTRRAFGLPILHTIKVASLSPSYSCRSDQEFKEGYRGTALFLSNYGKDVNSPDLLFNGACGAEDYFQASTAGDDMSLIADLGANVSLEDLTASRAFNTQRLYSFAAYSKFAQAAKVKGNHTYAVLLNGRDRRGLFVFVVTQYVPNKTVDLTYAVKAYQVMPEGQVIVDGFDWDQKNDR